MQGTRRRRSRGQAVTELVLVIPILAWLMLGAADMGRAYYLSVEISGSARAGLRAGITGGQQDIGLALRSEPNSAIPNSAAAWGSYATANCTASVQTCGSTSGCRPSDFTGNQTACFAVRTGTYAAGGCTFPVAGGWNTRPASNSDGCLGVRVVYKFQPATPLIAQLAGGSGGYFYLTADNDSLELY
ncbi:MAG: pilus assembly protein [Candidatus Dormibacteraeota bacterium]|nr:pilus assembly protein [Candidatus Dormibacteraeota bacterium]